MDERTGSPPGTIPHQVAPYGLRDSDDDVAGMVNLQQQDQPAYNDTTARGHESDPSSVYSRGVTSAQ
jgi:hypothetical protein